jgi:hypothetical protein
MHEGIWRSEGVTPPFLISAVDGGEWSVSCPGRFSTFYVTYQILVPSALHDKTSVEFHVEDGLYVSCTDKH